MTWRRVTVGELLEEYGIEIQTGPFGTQLKASDYVDSGVPVINVRNIGYGKLIDDKLEFVSDQTAQRLERHLLRKNDIVFGRKGAVDRHLLVSESEHGWLQGSDCIRLRITSDKLNPHFLSYSLLRNDHRQWIITQSGNKSTMASLNQDVIKRIPLSVPSTEIQSKIAGILQKYDHLIENNRGRIELLEQVARLLFKEWFVHYRFPGHEHVKIVDGVPEGWKKERVKHLIATVQKIKKIPKSDYHAHGRIPCVDQSREFIGGYTDDEEAKIDSAIPVIVFGDHTRCLKFVDFPFASGADGTQLLVTTHEFLTQHFLYFSLESIDLSNYFYARHFKFLKDQVIVVPRKEVVHDFTEFTIPIMNQIKNLRDYNNKLAQARDLLLPRLMNGEIAI